MRVGTPLPASFMAYIAWIMRGVGERLANVQKEVHGYIARA